MNYYTNPNNGYFMNNNDDRFNDEYYYDDYRNNVRYDYDNEKNGYGNEKRSCCVRRVEETYLCFPSYYNEDKCEKKEDNKENCFEGTFKICPKHYDNGKDYSYKHDDRDNKKENHKCGCRCHNRCGFCGLFRRW